MKNGFLSYFIQPMLVATALLAASCARKSEEAKCDDPPSANDSTKSGAASSTPAKATMEAKDLMWCRSCVVGPAGYMSCQTVRQKMTTETKDETRDRARLAACKDAGFPEGTCPSSGVISVTCKGDPPPEDKTAAGKAMLNALKSSGPLVLTKDGKTMKNIMYDEPSGPGAPPPKSDEKKAPAPSAGKPGTPHID